MSRISNELAGQIAHKLTEASRLEVEQFHTDYRELATSLYEDQTPDEVKKAKKVEVPSKTNKEKEVEESYSSKREAFLSLAIYI